MISAKIDLYIYRDIDMYVYIYTHIYHYCHHPHIFILAFLWFQYHCLLDTPSSSTAPDRHGHLHGSRSPRHLRCPGLEAAQELDFRCPQYGFSQSFCAVQGWHGKIRVKCWDFMVIWRFNGIERGHLGHGSHRSNHSNHSTQDFG